MKDLAKFAVTSRPYLLKNREPFAAFADVFNALTPEQKENLQPQLARIYLQFFKAPAKENGKLTPVKALAMFAGVKDVRYYLNYVYVSADRIGIASDGPTLLMTNSPLDLEPGFYDPKTGVKAYDLDYAKFPNFDHMLDAIKSTGKPVDINAVDQVETIGAGTKKPYQIIKIGDLWFQQQYLDRVKRVIPNGTATIFSKGVQIKDETYTALVMAHDAPK